MSPYGVRLAMFISLFLLVYGGAHAFILNRFRAAFPFGRPGTVAAAVAFGLLVVSPIAVRLVEGAGHEEAARVLARVAFGWMGFVVLLFFALLAGWLVQQAAWLSGLSGVVTPRAVVLTAAAVALTGFGWGVYEAGAIAVERLTVASPKVAPGERFRIMQISDVHLGLLERHERVAGIEAIAREERPDLIVSTGDLVDGSLGHLDGLSGRLAALPALSGKLAVTGNHEYYAGLQPSVEFTRRAGFELLRGANRQINGWLTVAGNDDPQGSGFGEPGSRPEAAFDGIGAGRFVLHLYHRPLIAPGTEASFDLQLSGHAHKGQIFPLSLFTYFIYPRHAGLLELPGGRFLWTSRGTGTWGPPIRVLAPPEATIIDLVHGAEPEARRTE